MTTSATDGTNLFGHTVLIVEHEPLIALDIIDVFKAAGASLTCPSLAAGRKVCRGNGICAAVVDLGFCDGVRASFCDQLSHKHMPVRAS